MSLVEERLNDYLVGQTGSFLQHTSAGIRAAHHESRMTFQDDAAGCCMEIIYKSLKHTIIDGGIDTLPWILGCQMVLGLLEIR